MCWNSWIHVYRVWLRLHRICSFGWNYTVSGTWYLFVWRHSLHVLKGTGSGCAVIPMYRLSWCAHVQWLKFHRISLINRYNSIYLWNAILFLCWNSSAHTMFSCETSCSLCVERHWFRVQRIHLCYVVPPCVEAHWFRFNHIWLRLHRLYLENIGFYMCWRDDTPGLRFNQISIVSVMYVYWSSLVPFPPRLVKVAPLSSTSTYRHSPLKTRTSRGLKTWFWRSLPI